jgi:hypothetical protein
MKNSDNIYEDTHVINICKEIHNNKEDISIVEPLSSTFNTVPAKNLEDAKKILEEATPKGIATMISENHNKSTKHIYVENINEFTITHIISIKKNGLTFKDTTTNDSSKETNSYGGKSKVNKFHSNKNKTTNKHKKFSKGHKRYNRQKPKD